MLHKFTQGESIPKCDRLVTCTGQYYLHGPVKKRQHVRVTPATYWTQDTVIE